MSTIARRCALVVGFLVVAWLLYDASRSTDPHEPAPSPTAESAHSEVAAGGVEREPGRLAQPGVPTDGAREELLAVRVETPRGTPVAGARLSGVSGSETLDLGATDAAGRLVVRGANRLDRVAAEAPGHPSTSRSRPDRWPHELVLVLGRATSIYGKVITSAGPPPDVPVWVVAWRRRDRPPDPIDVLQRAVERSGWGGFQLAAIDPGGAFEIEACVPGETYDLAAAGSGLMSREASRAIPAGTQEVSLVVGWGYAAVLELACAGVPVAISSTPGERGLLKRWTEDLEVELVPNTPPWACLAGLEPGLLSSPSSLISLFTKVVPDERAGPNHMTLQLPGYERVQVDFDALPLAQGGASVRVDLTATSEGTCGLRLRFRGLPPDLPPAARDHAIAGAVVALRSDGGEDHFAVASAGDATATVDRIPSGSRRLKFRARGSGLTVEIEGGRELELAAGATRELDVDLGELGFVQLELVRPTGDTYSGAIDVLVGQGPPRLGPGGNLELVAYRRVRLDGPPYVLDALREDSATLLFRKPRLDASQTGLGGSVHIEKSPSRFHAVTLRTRDEP